MEVSLLDEVRCYSGQVVEVVVHNGVTPGLQVPQVTGQCGLYSTDCRSTMKVFGMM